MDDLLESLNEEQRQAVTHDQGPMLLVAGAGTGKTQVITRRIAWLIREGKAQPGEILALTFTEKAAREMADRLHDLVGWRAFQVPVLTFNAFGAELLGRFAMHIGRSTRGGLINDTQKALLLKQRLGKINFEYYGPQADEFGFCQELIRYFGKLQNTGVGAAAYSEFASGTGSSGDWHEADVAEQRDLASLYSLYDQIKLETGTYDYADQIMLPLHILQQRPHLAARLQGEFRYVLVDEYQDTSPVQDELLRSWLPANGNIFAVGDDDQAIYSFRGADIGNILNFTQHYQVEAATALTRNYRSRQSILDASYRLICQNNPHRLEPQLGLDKRLRAAASGKGDNGDDKAAAVKFTMLASASEELGAVADQIQAITRADPKRSTAVLARSNGVLKNLAAQLRSREIAFAISAQTDIFSQQELVSLWCLLELLGYRATPEAVGHILTGPFFGWTAAECQRIIARARADGSDYETAMRVLSEEGNVVCMAAMEKIDQWREWAAREPISRLAYKLIFDTGVADKLINSAEGSDRPIRVFEDLKLLLDQMADFEVVAEDHMLAGYLKEFPGRPALETTERTGHGQGVQLLTVHAAKGLEFDDVFVVNCTTKAWSSRTQGGALEVPRALLTEPDLPPDHEQRRLMYVAATRAKQRLYLSAAGFTTGGQKQSVSPLVYELIDEPTVSVEPGRPDKESARSMAAELGRYYPLSHESTVAKLPFETDDGYLELSVGAASLYERCPHEFFLQHVLGISEPFGPQLAFGSVIHKLMQLYFEARLRNEMMTEAELQTRLAELWSDRGYESKDMAGAAHDRAADAIRRFVRRERNSCRQILGSEVPIMLDIAEAKMRLRGRIDAYFTTEAGVEIRDFKTGLRKDAAKIAEAAKKSFQLRAYAMAYQVMNGELPQSVTLDYVVTGVEGSAQLTPQIMTNFRGKLVKLAEGIRNRQFAPAPRSDYHLCAAFKYYGEADESVD